MQIYAKYNITGKVNHYKFWIIQRGVEVLLRAIANGTSEIPKMVWERICRDN